MRFGVVQNPSLQESFGFFESVKRYSCPVCKQKCSPNDAVRLYFESVCVSPSVTPAPPIGEDSEALRREVKELKDEVWEFSVCLNYEIVKIGTLVNG